jgi:hypothetical protein
VLGDTAEKPTDIPMSDTGNIWSLHHYAFISEVFELWQPADGCCLFSVNFEDLTSSQTISSRGFALG